MISFILLFVCALLPYSTGSTAFVIETVVAAVLLIVCAVVLRSCFLRSGKEKKPFRMTARIKRLIICLAIVLLLAAFLLWLVFRPDTGRSRLNQVVYSLIPLFLPVWVTLAAVLAFPIEKLIYELYFQDARKKLLANDRLIRIGITGSYGKF